MVLTNWCIVNAGMGCRFTIKNNSHPCGRSHRWGLPWKNLLVVWCLTHKVKGILQLLCAFSFSVFRSFINGNLPRWNAFSGISLQLHRGQFLQNVPVGTALYSLPLLYKIAGRQIYWQDTSLLMDLFINHSELIFYSFQVFSVTGDMALNFRKRKELWEVKRRFCRNVLNFIVMGTITPRLFTIGASLHIWKMCRNRGHGERNLHQGCRVIKIHKVGFELLWRNLPFMSELK